MSDGPDSRRTKYCNLCTEVVAATVIQCWGCTPFIQCCSALFIQCWSFLLCGVGPTLTCRPNIELLSHQRPFYRGCNILSFYCPGDHSYRIFRCRGAAPDVVFWLQYFVLAQYPENLYWVRCSSRPRVRWFSNHRFSPRVASRPLFCCRHTLNSISKSETKPQSKKRPYMPDVHLQHSLANTFHECALHRSSKFATERHDRSFNVKTAKTK